MVSFNPPSTAPNFDVPPYGAGMGGYGSPPMAAPRPMGLGGSTVMGGGMGGGMPMGGGTPMGGKGGTPGGNFGPPMQQGMGGPGASLKEEARRKPAEAEEARKKTEEERKKVGIETEEHWKAEEARRKAAEDYMGPETKIHALIEDEDISWMPIQTCALMSAGEEYFLAMAY